MSAMTEMARVKRDIASLVEAVNVDLRPGSKSGMPATDRRALRSEIESRMRELDELRSRLAG